MQLLYYKYNGTNSVKTLPHTLPRALSRASEALPINTFPPPSVCRNVLLIEISEKKQAS
jgi:hypothetical protein